MPQLEYDFEVIREGGEKILRIDLDKASYSPSIEDSPRCMRNVIELLIKIISVTRLVLIQRRDYEYDTPQTMILNEIASLIRKVGRETIFTYTHLLKRKSWERYIKEYFIQMQYIFNEELKQDPVFAFISLNRMFRSLKVRITKSHDVIEKDSLTHLATTINYALDIMKEWRLIVLTKNLISKHKKGNREIYRHIFHPFIKPNFMYTKLMVTYPENGIIVDNYSIGNAEVTIFQFPDSAKTLYHLIPPEFKLSEEKYVLLEEARKIMAEHRPSKEEYLDPELMREVFFNVGKDLLDDLAKSKNIHLKEDETDELAEILLRYTVGFGLIEILLADQKVQDANINSPPGVTPMYLVHGDYDDCYTNIIPTRAEVDGWATKLRLISGRPLDEANPVLDTELEIKGMRSRVSAVSPPLNPKGLGFSFRRHRDKPWTLPLFIKAGMLNSMAAGLLSFLIDGTRTMLIAGTRSSGKTSLLGGLMVEIMRRYRVITIEDTIELPTDSLMKLGYNIQPLKVASALAGKESSEVSATIGIRTTLRLGDSALIVGEVRSEEAKSLYEAMRVGAAANVVAGTIHGDSPYGVFDRVVNDIGVPKTSFKATDIIVISNPVKSAAGLKKKRRVLQITEVRKNWTDDPLREQGFVDLMKYDAVTDQLELTDALISGDSEVLKLIASNISDFAGSWDAVWKNIQLRSKCKEEIVKISDKMKNPDLLEAEFVIKCNDYFHKIIDKVKNEKGYIDNDRVFFEYKDIIMKEAEKYV